jgi:intracellular multiplication protein IcmL
MGADESGRKQKMTQAPTPSKPGASSPSKRQAPARPTAPKHGVSAKAPAALDGALFIAFDRLKKRVYVQTWLLATLSLVLTCALPFSGDIYRYFALLPSGEVQSLVGLDMPNMTNRAILSWATTSITEVMTMGFGDMDMRLPLQRARFTPKGWGAFLTTFEKIKVRETFKHSQLVLTTAPSNTPIVMYQGINQLKVYQWIVQVPVIMTYATNNNVTRRQRMTVVLTIVRVPSEQTFNGIAIQNWAVLQ